MKTKVTGLITGSILLETFTAFGRTATKTGAPAFADNLWLYLSLAVLALVAGFTFFLRRKQKKNSRKLAELQNTLASVRQTLKTLTEEQEEIVKQRTKALKKELKMLKQNLQAMENTLEESKRSARRNALLMTRISNTLRTNLNDILGFSSLLENEFALNEEPELFEYNENIRRSGEALLHLLNNIIDISKIESKNFKLHETACNLTEITRSLVEQFKPVAEQKGIHLVYKEEEVPVFAADNQAIRHILTNLIDNAVRYTEKGFIKISQTFNGKEIVWTIKDTGIGIDKAYLPDIFEPFRQQTLGYSKTTYQGAGLGLPLTKRMLNVIGGNLELESEKAVGTTVRVFFPYKKYVPEKKKPARKKKHPSLKEEAHVDTNLHNTGKRIVIFDEDRLESMLIKKILTGEETVVYDSSYLPEEWVEKILSETPKPGLLILDLDFSGKGNGSAVLKEIRKKFPELTDTPVIALSAYPDATGEKKALEAGFTAYLRKPFRKNQLISLINKLSSA